MRERFGDRADRLADGFRVRAIRELTQDLLAEGRLGDDSTNALAMLIIDATLDGDEVSLHVASRQLQGLYRVLTRSPEEAGEDVIEQRGRVVAFIEVAGWGLERVLSLGALAEIDEDSAGHEFLKAVNEKPGQTNGELAGAIGISDAEVSRVGRRLADAGLAAKRRIGRRNHWEVTPKGLHTLELLDSGGASRFQRPHLQFR